jgi:hypothetical protein
MTSSMRELTAVTMSEFVLLSADTEPRCVHADVIGPAAGASACASAPGALVPRLMQSLLSSVRTVGTSDVALA